MKWHAAWQGVLAALTLLVAGTTLSDAFGSHTAGLLTLCVAALQAGTTAYYAALSKAPQQPAKAP